MNTARVFQNNELNNHVLEKLVRETTSLLKLSIVQGLNATVNPDVYKATPTEISFGPHDSEKVPSVAQVVAERFSQYSQEKQRIIGLDLGRDYELTEQIHLAGIDMHAAKSVLEQVDINTRFGFINESNFSEEKVNEMAAELGTPHSFSSPKEAEEELKNLQERYQGIISADKFESMIADLSANSGVGLDNNSPNRALRFRVHQVKCVDETNPEWAGSDEISMGGVAVDPSSATTKIGEIFVGGGFDDGNRKTYSPPLVLHQFNMTGGTFPQSFMVTVALAEKDNGGMSKFIEELWKAVKSHVTAIIASLSAAAGAWIGGQIGGSIGTSIAGPLGTVIGAVVGAVIGALVAWLINALKDDIFKPQASHAAFYSSAGTFPGGSLVSPRDSLHFRDHGGHYQLTYDWQIIR